MAVSLLTISQATGQTAEPFQAVVDLTKHEDITFPEKVTDVLSVHFGKLSHYYSYYERLDSNLSKEKPYSDFLKNRPFVVYLQMVHRGDTVSVRGYLLPKIITKDAIAVFDHVQKVWQCEDGLVFPLYDESEVKSCPIDLLSIQQLWFTVRYIQMKGEGSECRLLDKS
jgi:hypothetical protein